jgi:hypothetical protein
MSQDSYIIRNTEQLDALFGEVGEVSRKKSWPVFTPSTGR